MYHVGKEGFYSHVVVAMRFRTTLGRSLILVVLLVVVGLHDLFTEILLSLVYISVEFVSVLSNREFLIVINRDVNSSRADWLVLRIVELCDVRVPQGLISRQTSVGIEH